MKPEIEEVNNPSEPYSVCDVPQGASHLKRKANLEEPGYSAETIVNEQEEQDEENGEGSDVMEVFWEEAPDNAFVSYEAEEEEVWNDFYSVNWTVCELMPTPREIAEVANERPSETSAIGKVIDGDELGKLVEEEDDKDGCPESVWF